VTATHAAAIDRLWSRWGVEVTPQRLDLQSTFGRRAPVVLELGFGMGEATAAIAAARPDCDFLVVDVHTPGVGNLLNLLDRAGSTNVRVVHGDGVEVLESMLAPASLDGFHVFFPDPWPKARHHKRRLVQPPFAALAASRLRPGGYLHCATDVTDYADQMLAVLSACPELENRHDGFAPRPAARPLTRFEQQGLDKGHTVRDLVLHRR
jgi:tRNA (guanine-N7-)-methyltransferase